MFCCLFHTQSLIIVQVAKEKALQLERKRKAAQFLAQLAEKKTTVSSNTAVTGDRDSSAEEGEITIAGLGAEMINVSELGARPVIVSPVSQ